jgi:hypothetical protein
MITRYVALVLAGSRGTMPADRNHRSRRRQPLACRVLARKARSGNIDFGTLFIVLLVAVPVVGGILRSMFGNVAGSLAGGGIAGVAAWFLAGSMLIAGIAGVVAFFIILFSIFGGRGGWIPIGGGGGGGGWRRRGGGARRRRRIRRRWRVGWMELTTA